MLILMSFLNSMLVPAIRILIYFGTISLSFLTVRYISNLLGKDHEKDL